jgi:hypothetical protein
VCLNLIISKAPPKVADSIKRASPPIWASWLLIALIALFALVAFSSLLSKSLETEIHPADSPEFTVELLLDESYWWMSLGETETTLERLDELMAYCELTGQEVPEEAEILYEEAFEDWLLFSDDYDNLLLD